MHDLLLWGYPVHVRTVLSVDTDRGPIIVPIRTYVHQMPQVDGLKEITLTTNVSFRPEVVLDAITDAEWEYAARPKRENAPKPKAPNEVAAEHLEKAAKALREAG